MPALPQLHRAASWLLAALLLALPVGSARARPEPTQAAADPAVVAPIQALDEALIRIMKAGRSTPFQQRADMLAQAVEQAFDLPDVLKFSVGPGWSALTAEQQAALLAAFRRYTIASYVENFDNYDGQRIVVSPTTRTLPDGRQVVSTEIIPKSGQSHTLEYVMRKTNGGWKAVDVLADGAISRVAVQRSDFGAVLNRGGVPALEASLQEKSEALSRG